MWASTFGGGWSSSDGTGRPGSALKLRHPRLIAILICLIALFSWPGNLRADGTRGSASDQVQVLVPPPPPESEPALEAPKSSDGAAICHGRLVSRVETRLSGEAWGIRKPPVVRAVRPGRMFSPSDLRAGLRELLALRHFASAKVLARPEGVACSVEYVVTARRVIDKVTIDLDGANVDQDELLREGNIAVGGELIGAELADRVERMEVWLARRGYPEAWIALDARATDDPLHVVVKMKIHAGKPRLVDRRVFYVFGASPEAVRAETDAYTVKAHAPADETALELSDRELERKLHARGYFTAVVSHDVVKHRERIVLRVRVDAKTKFLFRFEGNTAFDSDTLRGALEVDKERDLTPSHLADKVREYYQAHGFLDVEIAVRTRGTSKDRINYLVFGIIEHHRVKVDVREYPCLQLGRIGGLPTAPSSAQAVGTEIDSFLEEELPGSDLIVTPDPEGVDALVGRPPPAGGTRQAPMELSPTTVYHPETYERAVEHVQELYRSEGFLHAIAGPVQVIRHTCSKKSPPGRCIPISPKVEIPDACTYDATNLPLEPARLPRTLTCTPDPAHGIECEPRVRLRIPIKLGPRTTLYDMDVHGARSISERKLERAADLKLGEPASTSAIEEARRRIVDAYREEGYAFADVKASLDESPDHSRARAVFEVNEGERVIVKAIEIRGNALTNESVIRRRIALEVGKPYRSSLVQKTQERIATLNIFTSVNVALADPYVPKREKNVIITVTEVIPQSVEIRPGFSTGEGFRIENAYSHRNWMGTAIGFSARVRLSYLPDEFILDPGVRENFRNLDADANNVFESRMGGRITVRGEFPDVGLGPLVRLGVDGVFARTLMRDFVLNKAAAIPTVFYTPIRQVQFSLSPTAERNEVKIFKNIKTSAAEETLDEYLARLQNETGNVDLARLLRVPDGASNAFAQRFQVTWDRRDNSFNAHTGTYMVSGVEHVDWFPTSRPVDNDTVFEGHFLRFTQKFAGYIPIGKKITFAAILSIGANVQLTENSKTYPDRLFFLGGVQSLRGWNRDAFYPQDFVDRIRDDAETKPDTDPSKLTAAKVGLRGGNLMVNPRIEIRIPIRGIFETVIFSDAGNVWVDPLYPFERGFRRGSPLRFSGGSGLRIQTPIGPIAFDYGVNISRYLFPDDYLSLEDFGAFHFAIGLF